MQSSVGGGQRSSAATAYLNPSQERDNLDILINTHVTKLVLTGARSWSKPEFRAIQVAQSSGGRKNDKSFLTSNNRCLQMPPYRSLPGKKYYFAPASLALLNSSCSLE